MQQVWIPRIGPPEVLELRQAPDPRPGPGQVRIAVEAAGVNFADLMARMGLYPDAPRLPAVVGYEAAGSIDAVGDGAEPSRVGEPVLALTRFGGYSSRLCVPAAQAVRRPSGLDAAAAAAIPVNGLTAWMMLEEMGRLRAGDRVLVHGAGGGVGLLALDLIRRRGAVAVGAASPGKHAWLRARGYDQLVDARAPLPAQLPPGSFDLVLDPVGGRSWAEGLQLLRPGGRIVLYGFSANAGGERRSLVRVLRNLAAIPWWRLGPIALINHNQGVLGVNLGRMWQHAELAARWLAELLRLWEQGALRPHVHARVPFSRAAEAHRILHRRENLGKVVLVPDP
ncbi:MAG: alcohol dehydrogenase [Planctomycetota bacterium]|nr:MAG: alcohol dehydrogenase [Planctomycetota bacterium]